MHAYANELAPVANDILNFWFVDDHTHTRDQPKLSLWFGGGDADQTIADRFTDSLQKAADGGFASWQQHPLGTLALIVLLDQFPRNIYRGTAKAFAYGEQAITICENGLAAQQDRQLNVMERSFFYLPLEHSENVEHANRSVALHQQLVNEAPQTQKHFADNALEYARQHQQIIAQFGRYPYRNEVLQRRTTDAEARWMAATNERFGQ